MVTTFYPPFNFGGDGIGIQRFSRALVRRGHEVTVVQDVDAYRALAREPLPVRTDQDDGVKIELLQSRVGPLSVALTHQLGRPVLHGRRFQKLIDEGRFDVINFHNISLIGGPGILRYGTAVKIFMAHEHWLICPSHVLWRHQREPCTGRECIRCVLNYHRPPQLWRYSGSLDRELRHVDAFIAMSDFSRRKHREFGFPFDMEVVNYFLPDLPEESRQPVLDSQTGRPYFLFVGRLEKIKGLDEVIDVFRRYDGADLIVAGDGEDGNRLRDLARELPHVKFLGRLDSSQLDALYRNAVALIVPSVGFETFGIILIEAFRHGTPVIARRMGPFPEIVERCGGGELFETPSELEQAMKRLQTEPIRRSKLAQNAARGFTENWSESAVMPRYLEVIRRAAEAKGHKSIIETLN